MVTSCIGCDSLLIKLAGISNKFWVLEFKTLIFKPVCLSMKSDSYCISKTKIDVIFNYVHRLVLNIYCWKFFYIFWFTKWKLWIHHLKWFIPNQQVKYPSLRGLQRFFSVNHSRYMHEIVNRRTSLPVHEVTLHNISTCSQLILNTNVLKGARR